VARAHPGTAFVMPQAAASCAHPERLAFVAERLHWLSPLDRLSKDEQRGLGLLASNGRPSAEAEDLAIESGEENDVEVIAEYGESERQGTAGTLVAP
jgi:hypothetical protein